jgi:hypothetical protein
MDLTMPRTPDQATDPAERPCRASGKPPRTFAPALAARKKGLLDTLVTRALGGHPASLRACGRWGIIVGRGRPLPLRLAPVENIEDARAAMAQIVTALRAGKLTVRETAILLTAVEPFWPDREEIALVRRFARIEGDLAKAAAAIGIDYMFTMSEGPQAARARLAAARGNAPPPSRPNESA